MISSNVKVSEGSFLFKADEAFGKEIEFGDRAQEIISYFLALFGHRMIPLDAGAQSPTIYKDAERKRIRQTDLSCARCGLRVESRGKRRYQIALSHSESRPFWAEHANSDIVSIISPRGIAFYRIRDLKDVVNKADQKRNRYGEPFLEFRTESVKACEIPICVSTGPTET